MCFCLSSVSKCCLQKRVWIVTMSCRTQWGRKVCTYSRYLQHFSPETSPILNRSPVSPPSPKANRGENWSTFSWDPWGWPSLSPIPFCSHSARWSSARWAAHGRSCSTGSCSRWRWWCTRPSPGSWAAWKKRLLASSPPWSRLPMCTTGSAWWAQRSGNTFWLGHCLGVWMFMFWGGFLVLFVI